MDFYDSILGWLIILGSIVPYGFQYYKICKHSSVKGISGLMLLSGCISSFFSLLAIIFNNFYIIINSNNSLEKYLLSLPIIQLGSSFILLEINYLLYFFYNKLIRHRIIYILWHIIQSIVCIIIFPILLITLHNNNVIYIFFNVTSGLFSVIMWLPQIVITIKQKDSGSLSITSLIIQAIGCLLVILFQLLDNTSPTIIIPYVISALSEITLVIMCFYYKYLPKKNDDFLLLTDEV